MDTLHGRVQARDAAIYGVFGSAVNIKDGRHMLNDLLAYPAQLQPVQDAGVQARLQAAGTRLMLAKNAPPEKFGRSGLQPG